MKHLRLLLLSCIMKLHHLYVPAFAGLILLLSSCDNSRNSSQACYPWKFESVKTDLSKYVNPFIGTGGHGHTFPGATAPFGMVQLSPDTRIDGSWDGCSGYHYSDSIIYGFSHTHLSGTGCSDYGDIMLMPGQGEKMFVSGNDSVKGYRTGFSHANEKAEAGYYSVKLNNGINCEMTASPRVGVHRYTFNGNEPSWIILDMAHRDEVLECEIEIVDDRTIRGKRFSKAWATNQQLWFYAEFSEPFKHEMRSNGQTNSSDTTTAKDAKVLLSFDVKEVEIKLALSPVSTENAKLNLQTETGGMNFNAVKEKVHQHWNKELSCIEVESQDETKKRIFYTALYHCFIAPNVYCDVNGDYQGMDHKVYRDTVHQRYTVFSLWDTYRALHPLFTVVQQKRTNDFINTFLQQYEESGRLPVWELSSNETDCMIGYHSVSVIADAWMKGITDYDTTLALEAMVSSAMQDRTGLKAYKSCGFIPSEGEGESVSKTLEYAYDDWCIAQCALRMKNDSLYRTFSKRANNWKNLFNPETGFLQARMNNSFISPFNPYEVNFHYTEANAWQYSLAVQHDPLGLARVMGGAEQFEAHLDSLFTASSKTTGRDQADITGLIGQYAHGNEPSHHMAYLYSAIGCDYKTQKLVHQICNELYSDQPDGLSGNEDCGQMSAWYVLSAAGIYAITPGKPEFVIGSPQFEKTIFHLENGNVFTISSSNVQIDKPFTSIEPQAYNDNLAYSTSTASAISYSFIMTGGKIETVKSSIPVIPSEKIYLVSAEPQTPVTPWIMGNAGRTFTDRMSISMKALSPEQEIYYQLNNEVWAKYVKPITITENSSVKMYSFINGERSDTATAEFFKAPSWKSIAIRNAYAPQYAAGGDRALIDGLKGSTNFRTGLWQGYEGTDIDITIDMGSSKNVDSVQINFLRDENSWIFLPVKIEYNLSDSPNAYPEPMLINEKPMSTFTDAVNPALQIATYGGSLNKTGRYLHITVTGIGKCPKGHFGEGKPAWLFADEITIKTK